MSPSHRPFPLSLLPLLLLSSLPLPASATSTLNAFSDPSCHTLVGTAFTVDGGSACQTLPGVRSVNTTNLGDYCAVTVYSDTDCNDNPTLAPLHTCTANASIYYSLSVDCKLPDGSWEASNPTQTASLSLAGSSSVPSSSSPSPATHVSSSLSTSATSFASSSLKPPTYSALLSSSSKTPATTSVSSIGSVLPATALSSLSASTMGTVISSTTSSSTTSSTTAPPPASSTTTSGQGGGKAINNGNLSTGAQIAIGVVVPAVGVIVAVVFGIRMWHRKG
ncbi:MAG: hypothetical protein FRX48_06874 [Lasallia pustulata]|uniref:Uncharacterized protein n=1 Tax=Lasallia pustulata TaxID=136370 RepID=A0A5M8PIS8_9LECA|nr:MAG: hypothetical protein FRX48_06874 [Lasallia pustulata]